MVSKRTVLEIVLIGMVVFSLTGPALAGPTGAALRAPATTGGSATDAGAPAVLNYQGLLLDNQGQPVSDGSYTLTLALYDVISGSTALWSEAQTVTVTNGLFNVTLGSVTPLDPALFDGQDLWLGITLQGEAEMAPRTQLTSVPYALNAGDVRGADIHPNSVYASTSGTAIHGESSASSVHAVEGFAPTDNGFTSGVYGHGYNGVFGNGSNTGVRGESSATDGHGVHGWASAYSGPAYGVSGQTYSSDGSGVYGYASAPNGSAYGVYGKSDSTAGTGVYGDATATSGPAIGVYGRSASSGGAGLYGFASATSGNVDGVVGDVMSTEGSGVYGRARATVGTTYGLYGEAWSTEGRGVYGIATATSGVTRGVWGESSSSTGGMGVIGVASAASGYTIGVGGFSDSPDGTGVAGIVYLSTGQNVGVFGRSDSSEGIGVEGFILTTVGANYAVYGTNASTGGYGVYGYATATSGSTYGVYGRTDSPDGWSGVFQTFAGNGVLISTLAGKSALIVAGGTKNAVVATAGGARLLYSEESSEVWFSDYGFGQLQDGVATVNIDPIFAQTVNLEEPYHVFLTAMGAEDVVLRVESRSPTGFTVVGKTLDGKPASGDFDYRIVARRLGYEKTRLERAPWADNDPNLYPGKRAEWEQQHPSRQSPALVTR